MLFLFAGLAFGNKFDVTDYKMDIVCYANDEKGEFVCRQLPVLLPYFDNKVGSCIIATDDNVSTCLSEVTSYVVLVIVGGSMKGGEDAFDLAQLPSNHIIEFTTKYRVNEKLKLLEKLEAEVREGGVKTQDDTRMMTRDLITSETLEWKPDTGDKEKELKIKASKDAKSKVECLFVSTLKLGLETNVKVQAAVFGPDAPLPATGDSVLEADYVMSEWGQLVTSPDASLDQLKVHFGSLGVVVHENETVSKVSVSSDKWTVAIGSDEGSVNVAFDRPTWFTGQFSIIQVSPENANVDVDFSVPTASDPGVQVPIVGGVNYSIQTADQVLLEYSPPPVDLPESLRLLAGPSATVTFSGSWDKVTGPSGGKVELIFEGETENSITLSGAPQGIDVKKTVISSRPVGSGAGGGGGGSSGGPDDTPSNLGPIIGGVVGGVVVIAVVVVIVVLVLRKKKKTQSSTSSAKGKTEE